MLSQKMQDALNAQINAEFWSAYLYLSMSAFAHAQGYPGMAHWFEVQYQEELDHVKIFFDYILQRDGRVMLDPIQGVPTEWANPLEIFQSTLKHEQTVTLHRVCLNGSLMSRLRKRKMPRTSLTA